MKPVMNHTERAVPYTPAQRDMRLFHSVTAHVESHIGAIEWILPDPHPDVVRVDLLWIPPGGERNYHTFVTCGMASLAMHPPDEWGELSHAELVLRLPASWNLDRGYPRSERDYWPLRELDQLARLPHQFATWLWAGHVVANGEPPRPICSSVGFCGTMLGFPAWTKNEFRVLEADTGRSVHFFSLLPLYADELLFARQFETKLLLDWIAQAGITDCVDTGRPSLVSAVC